MVGSSEHLISNALRYTSSSLEFTVMPSPALRSSPLTTRDTLEFLDGTGKRLIERFDEDGYVLWLGSGISFGRLDRLNEVVEKLLVFLQNRINPADADCRFRTALGRALRLVMSDDDANTIDLLQPPNLWKNLGEIISDLTSKYSDLLDITVDGEEDDYLLWEAVLVTDTFADPTTEPDAEHLCIAILALEGVVTEIMSANWDGLIEKSSLELSGNAKTVGVLVKAEDVRHLGSRSKLYKFHGCAVLARDDEHNYRSSLVARKSQIDRWRDDNRVLVDSLIGVVRSRPALIVGLSAQDSNIRALFSAASASLNWPWPGDYPAIAFAQTKLGDDQRILLKDVYRDAMTPANRDAIQAEAHIPTYAKQLLLALVVNVLARKLITFCSGIDANVPPAEIAKLATGLTCLRDRLADSVPADSKAAAGFVRLLVQHISRTLGIFRNGEIELDSLRYRPLTLAPRGQIDADPTTAAGGLQEFAVAMAMLGEGQRLGWWLINAADPSKSTSGALEVQTTARKIRLFFISSAEAALRLSLSGRLSSSEQSVVVHSKTVLGPKKRSPSRFTGRTGLRETRQVSVRELLTKFSTAKDLAESFRREVAL